MYIVRKSINIMVLILLNFSMFNFKPSHVWKVFFHLWNNCVILHNLWSSLLTFSYNFAVVFLAQLKLRKH